MSATEKQAADQQESVVAVASEATEAKAAVSQCEIDALIRKRVYAAIALGLAPLPLVDLVGLYGIQVELVSALAHKYEVPFKKDMAKTLIGSLVGSVLPVAAAPAFFSLFKLIPIIGWSASATTMSIIGGASTYAVGRVFDKHFASGGTLLQADTGALREAFKEKYEEGKSFVSKMGNKKAPAAQDTVGQQSAS